MLLVIVLPNDFDREFLRSPECFESQAPTILLSNSIQTDQNRLANGSFRKRILDQSLLECHHRDRRDPSENDLKRERRTNFQVEKNLLFLERIVSSLDLFEIKISWHEDIQLFQSIASFIDVPSRSYETVHCSETKFKSKANLSSESSSLYFWKHLGRRGNHRMFPR